MSKVMSNDPTNISARNRRARLKAGGFCINGESHGKATHGRRCAWCDAVHKKKVEKVLDDPNAPARPPGYRVRMRATPTWGDLETPEIQTLPDSDVRDVSRAV